jgi:hypothetical protein
MIHPLLRIAATEPQLLADHAQAYGGLVSEELAKAAAVWKLRAALMAAAFGLGAVAVIFCGIGLMLWAALGDIATPWGLIAVPAVTAAVAAACFMASRRQHGAAFETLTQQLAADFAMLREVSAA